MKKTAVLLTLFALAGCANLPESRIPVIQSSGSTQASVELVTVLAARQVWLQQQNSGTNWGSAAVGGALGGWLGSRVGKGNGKTLATAAGAAIGASAGNSAGDVMNRTLAWEIIVRRQDGRELVVTQPAAAGDIPPPGSTARLVSSSWGNSRVIP